MNCFIPPILLKNVARHGDAELRDWALEALGESERGRGFRDAHRPAGKKHPGAQRLRRTVFDAHGKRILPGSLIRREGTAAVLDAAANEAYDNCGHAHRFLLEAFERQSVDGAGLGLEATVHYGRRYANAFWNGEQMVFGDGDGKVFGRFTPLVDIVAHELGHGVIQYEAALTYSGQSGALNEHFADVFGVLTKQFVLGLDAESSDWLVGAGVFGSGIKAVAVRSMKAPGSAFDDPLLGRDTQPAHMRDYVETDEDDGGVHLNNSIPNRAFYEVARMLRGAAWERAGQIWYRTLCARLRADARFQDCADATYAEAADAFGRDSRERRAVKSGWKRVGIEPVVRLPRVTQRLTGAMLHVDAKRSVVSIGEEAGVRPETMGHGRIEN